MLERNVMLNIEIRIIYVSNLLDWGTNLTKLLISYRDACKT